MLGTVKSLSWNTGSNQSRSAWRELRHVARDVAAGGLGLVVWAALWTSVWAAVAGPLAPLP